MLASSAWDEIFSEVIRFLQKLKCDISVLPVFTQ